MFETRLISHSRRVCKLYKDALHSLREHYDESHVARYHQVLLRARFEKHKNEKDLIKAKSLLNEGIAELEAKKCNQPLKYTHSPGGAAYNTTMHWCDSLLDAWHPIEKMAYKTYFDKREKAKDKRYEEYKAENQ